MRLALGLVLVALVAMAVMAPPAQAQIQLTDVDPPDGAKLDVAPEVVHVCFSQPVNINDITTFGFGFRMPDGRQLGLRTEFDIDGNCADVYPGLPQERPAGEYTFQWKVTAAEGDEEGSGSLTYEVTSASGVTPTATATASETPRPDGADGHVGSIPGGEDDGGPDILLIALLTMAVAGGAAVLATLGYFLRKRIGYEPHRPPPEGGEGHEH